MKKYKISLIFLFAIIAGCAAVIAVDSDFNPETDFSRYNSFALEIIEHPPSGDPRLDDNPFFDSRIRTALQEEFTNRGLEMDSEEDADLIIHYHMFVEHRERLDVDELDRELDTARGYIFYRELDIDTIAYDEGTFMLDVADANNKEVIWRGWARVVVTDVLDDHEALDRRIRQAINKIVSEYPQS